MCMYMYMYMYVYVYAYAYVYIHVCVCIYIYMCICVYVYMYREAIAAIAGPTIPSVKLQKQIQGAICCSFTPFVRKAEDRRAINLV